MDESWFTLYYADGRQHGVKTEAARLWYGQAHAIGNEHRCILLMAMKITQQDPWVHCQAIHSSLLPRHCHVEACQCTAQCCSCKDLYTIPGSLDHPISCMACTLTGYVTHLRCSGSACTTACSNSCQ